MTDRDHHSIEASTAWARSGLMFLTGRAAGRPLGAPAALIDGARVIADDIAVRSSRLGRSVVVEPLALMAERAASDGLRRRGAVSCGAGSRLMQSDDGWIAVTLARAGDWDLLAALLALPFPVGKGEWATVAAAVSRHEGRELRSRAELLGLPLALLGERRGGPDGRTGPPGALCGVRSRRVRSASDPAPAGDLVVVDLSALWAGPLVGRLLRLVGARVVKIESTSRPDGRGRPGSGFYERLNGGKETVAVDVETAAGRRDLNEMVSRADVVISASRPRALEHLELDPEDLVREQRPRVWLSISGYGHQGPSGHRVAFGDDAAVAGGLVAWDGPTPCFCGDAIADPLAGLAGTAAVLSALESDGAWLIDASMADIAGGMTGPALPVDGLDASHPGRQDPFPCSPHHAAGAESAPVMAERDGNED